MNVFRIPLPFFPPVPLYVLVNFAVAGSSEPVGFDTVTVVSGVPTAISYDVARVGDSYGAVYEMLHAKTLSSIVMEKPELAEEMGRRMGKLLKELHETPANTTKLANMLSVYKDRARKMEKYLTDKELEKLASVYEALSDQQTMLHGDYHAKNIMYMDGELIFIDMGDAGYGHPLLDVGGSYLGMMHVGKTNPDAVIKYIGVDYETVKTLWKNMLLEYFGEENVHDCGQCDVCLRRKKHSDSAHQHLQQRIAELLADHEWHALTELSKLNANHDHLQEALSRMIDEEEVEVQRSKVRLLSDSNNINNE